jgi:calpain-15
LQPAKEKNGRSKLTRAFGIAICPLWLFFESIFIYLGPCLGSYLLRCASSVCCCFRSCCKYRDKAFPANDTSIGWADPEIVWKDGTSLFGDEKVCLFQADVHPDDVKQGVLGNCWLISAIAAMAEFPGAVQNMMPTKERSRRGKYSLRLWNVPKKKWVVVTVDDQIPCNKSNGGLPHFAKPNGNEMWVMLFEKAFAKYVSVVAMVVGGMGEHGAG